MMTSGAWQFAASNSRVELSESARASLCRILALSPPEVVGELAVSVLSNVLSNYPSLLTPTFAALIDPFSLDAALLRVLQVHGLGRPALSDLILRRSSPSLARGAFELIGPAAVIKLVRESYSSDMPSCWIMAAVAYPDALASELLRSPAASLGFWEAIASNSAPSLIPVDFPTDPWLAFLEIVRPIDLPQSLSCYLAARALSNYSSPELELLICCFDSLHAHIFYSRLTSRQWSVLEAVLPSLDEYRNWDRCLRLRVAIANILVAQRAPLAKIERVTSSDQLLGWLIEAIRSVDGGKKYLKAIFKQDKIERPKH